MSPIAPAYTQAQAAAQAAAGAQHYPTGALYVVATPIGNLADISLRALYVLGLVDTVACEDTRHTGQLLHAYGIHKPLLALHEHNEAQGAQKVAAKLQAGERVAYVSDAGTPGISDPGSRLVAAVQAAQLRAIPVPGASSLAAIISVAGGIPSAQQAGFVFAGFLPPKGRERTAALTKLASEARAVVLLEAPHRIASLLDDLSALGERAVTVGRELTKQFETVITMPAQQLPSWLSAKAEHLRGEFVLVLHPPSDLQTEEAAQSGAITTTTATLLQRLLTELPLRTAVQIVTDISRQSKNDVYEQALAIKNSQPS